MRIIIYLSMRKRWIRSMRTRWRLFAPCAITSTTRSLCRALRTHGRNGVRRKEEGVRLVAEEGQPGERVIFTFGKQLALAGGHCFPVLDVGPRVPLPPFVAD